MKKKILKAALFVTFCGALTVALVPLTGVTFYLYHRDR